MTTAELGPRPMTGWLRMSFVVFAAAAGCADVQEADVKEALPPLSLEVDEQMPRGARHVKSAPVRGMELHEVEPFDVALRTPEIGYYPCATCHQHPVGDRFSALQAMHRNTVQSRGDASGPACTACHTGGDPRAIPIQCQDCHARDGVEGWAPSGRSHPTIELVHPNGSPEVCFTCHARENPGLLVLQDGQRAEIDEAYRLCAGCHFSQAEDWVGGAHGKRLAGWRGERVVLSCTGCHDPHDPLFPIKPPVAFPNIPRLGGGH